MTVKLISTERVTPTSNTCNCTGQVQIEPARAAWLLTMLIGAFTGVVFYATIPAFGVFLVLSAVTLCAGHSVGMHRLLIHRSFSAPLWLERTLVYLGTLVGMAGPFGMIKAHDMRDWHQRQTECPPHPSHDTHFFKDAFWQLCCRYQLDRPPVFSIEQATLNDRFYRLLEKTWMVQQLPIAALLYSIGGTGWVLWGVCLRVSVSLVGHWAVGHIAHKCGDQTWAIDGLPVQGYNLPRLGLITFGESFHGNHHAFPHSAKLGLEKGEIDTGYLLIVMLRHLGLAHNVKGPMSEQYREGLYKVETTMNIRSPYKIKKRRIRLSPIKKNNTSTAV